MWQHLTGSDFIYNLIFIAVNEAWRHKIPEGKEQIVSSRSCFPLPQLSPQSLHLKEWELVLLAQVSACADCQQMFAS